MLGLLTFALLSVTLSPVSLAAADVEDLLLDLQLVPVDARPAPDFTLENLDGKRVSLAEFRGRPVLVYFWTTW